MADAAKPAPTCENLSISETELSTASGIYPITRAPRMTRANAYLYGRCHIRIVSFFGVARDCPFTAVPPMTRRNTLQLSDTSIERAPPASGAHQTQQGVLLTDLRHMPRT